MVEKVSNKNHFFRALRPRRVVALCALKLEARALREALEELHGEKAATSNSSGENPCCQPASCEVCKCGIGPGESGRLTIEIIKRCQPDLIVNFGAAGALGAGGESGRDWKIGELAVGTYIRDIRESEGCGGYTPHRRFINAARRFGFNPARIGSTGTTVRCARQGREIAQAHGIELIDMEAFFIADAARTLGVDTLTLKVISDFADDAAEQDFHRHASGVITPAARQAARVIMQLMTKRLWVKR